MRVNITEFLNKDVREEYEEARKRASEALAQHILAENEAFMALMSIIDVGIGDRVKITRVGWQNKVETYDAILFAPRAFKKTKRDGTAGMHKLHVYAPYTIEKFNPPE